jgi:hypothetical protein
MTLSPDAMNYLAKVRESLARCSTIPSTPIPQGVVDEIAAAEPMEVAQAIEKDWMTARWYIGHIGTHTMGVADPERGHETLTANAISYLREVLPDRAGVQPAPVLVLVP